MILKLTSFLNTQDYLLTSLLSYSGSLEIQSIMRRTMEKYCRHQLEPMIHDPLQLEYQSIVTAGSIFAIVQHWLVTDKKISPEELAEVVMRKRFPMKTERRKSCRKSMGIFSSQM